MNKELEEAIDICENVIKDTVIGTYCIEIQKETNCSENCKNCDCYLITAIETVLNYIDNSISKEVIEEKIEEYKQQLKNNTKRVVQLQVLEQNKSLQQSEWEELNILFGDIEKIRGKIEALEELLKKN